MAVASSSMRMLVAVAWRRRRSRGGMVGTAITTAAAAATTARLASWTRAFAYSSSTSSSTLSSSRLGSTTHRLAVAVSPPSSQHHPTTTSAAESSMVVLLRQLLQLHRHQTTDNSSDNSGTLFFVDNATVELRGDDDAAAQLAFCHAYRSAVASPAFSKQQPQSQSQPQQPPPSIPITTILFRLGYREQREPEQQEPSSSDSESASSTPQTTPPHPTTTPESFPGDAVTAVWQDSESAAAATSILRTSKRMIHNIGPAYIRAKLWAEALGSATASHATTNTTNTNNPTSTWNQNAMHHPLVQLKRDFPHSIRLIAVLHNPEEAMAAAAAAASNNTTSNNTTTTAAARYAFLQSLLTESFGTLQELSTVSPSPQTGTTINTNITTKSNTTGSTIIDGFGVASNGLSLPPDHPMHVPYAIVLQAAAAAAAAATQPNLHPVPLQFCAIQLPVNALEPNGVAIACAIQQAKQQQQQQASLSPSSSSSLQNLLVYGMRPLTCYPHDNGGAGFGSPPPNTTTTATTLERYPVLLVDHAVSVQQTLPPNDTTTTSNSNSSNNVSHQQEQQQQTAAAAAAAAAPRTVWTNEAEATSVLLKYETILKIALSHFDAHSILDNNTDTPSDEWTTQDRETLDGCKLLQSLLHDLDHSLPLTVSVAAHDDEIMHRIIPLIHDTFEGYDEETADILQSYFSAYRRAVHYHVARNTRRRLLNGSDGGDDHPTLGRAGHDTEDSDKLDLFSLGNGTCLDLNTQNEKKGAMVESSRKPSLVYSPLQLPPNKRLQEFALEFVLSQTVPTISSSSPPSSSSSSSPIPTTPAQPVLFAFDKILLGCSQPCHALDGMNIVQKHDATFRAAQQQNNRLDSSSSTHG